MHLYEWADANDVRVVLRRTPKEGTWRAYLEDEYRKPLYPFGNPTLDVLGGGLTQEAALTKLAERVRGGEFRTTPLGRDYEAPANLFYAGHDIS